MIMTKRFFSIICWAITLVGIISCQQELPKQTLLSLSVHDLSFNGDGGKVEVVFSANSNWTIKSSEAWCSPSIESGLFDGEQKFSIDVSCEPNTSFEERKCYLEFTCKERTEYLSITQAANYNLYVAENDYWAMAILGNLLYRGKVLPQERTRAEELLGWAAHLGCSYAKELLEEYGISITRAIAADILKRFSDKDNKKYWQIK